MRIGIVGAGAIGCALAARLSQGGQDVALVVRDQARRARLAADGLTCVEAEATVHGAPQVVAALEAASLDILFLTVKAADLPAAVASVPDAAVGPDTLVVPLANGVPWWLHMTGSAKGRVVDAVDPDGTLLARFAAHQIVGSVVYTTAMMTGPASVKVMRAQSLILGAVTGEANERIDMLAALLRDVGVGVDISARIRDDVWTKVALNLATNPLSVVTQAGLATLCSDRQLLPIVETVLDETWRVAARYDARPLLTRSQMLARGRAAGAFRTSMLEDHVAGRPLELGAIADAVFELGEAVGVELPIARSIADLARYRAEATPAMEKGL